MTVPFFTIGHSNRSLEAFVELLKEVHTDLVADIRTIPRSRTNPQFNKSALPDALAAFDVSYEHMAALGGLRGKTRTSPPDVNGFWTNESFHNYADYALSAEFHSGLGHLLGEGSTACYGAARLMWLGSPLVVTVPTAASSNATTRSCRR